MGRVSKDPEVLTQKAKQAEMQELMKKLEIHDMDDINDLFKALVSATLKNGLESEIEEELGYSKYDYKNRDTENYRNGHSKKMLKTSFGEMETDIPRDQNGEYEPQIIKKQQTTLSGDIEEKIISMCAKGMTTGDIEGHIQEIYGLDVSDSTVSRITDTILPIAKEWQRRPLESIYAVVFMDAIHYHVRKEGSIVKKAVCIAIGVDLNGMKDVLGMWVGENESAKFWLPVMNEIKNRGTDDILIIRPYTPRHNCKVERSHREDQKRFYSCHSFHSFSDFALQLNVYLRKSNSIPMRPLAFLSPLSFLSR